MLFLPPNCCLELLSPMLNGSDESWSPCLVPDFTGKGFSLLPCSKLAVVFLINAIHQVKEGTSNFSFLGVIMKGCWILSNTCSSLKWSLCPPHLPRFALLMWHITLTFWLSHPCIPRINPTWSWYITLKICCWILFTNSLMIFVFIFVMDIGLYFSYVLVWFWYYGPHRMT